ncbi:ubiquitin-conjugating enzyme E2 4 [Rhizophagus irregularis DAOM 181602=DAOM 197198]|nr:ubiquitin-conjugating enzyme E2 4 [Rhizophagus irregularis DAOM 181602=DAOM 197198]
MYGIVLLFNDTELYELGRDPPSSFSVGPIDDDLFPLASIMGPVIILHTLEVYFIFDICHPSDYPFKPPKNLQSGYY